MTACPLCACPRSPDDVRGLAWSSQHGADGTVWLCPGCTRNRLIEIETLVPLAPFDGATHRRPAA